MLAVLVSMKWGIDGVRDTLSQYNPEVLTNIDNVKVVTIHQRPAAQPVMTSC